MIYSYTNLWHGQRLGPESASDEIIIHHTTRIFQVAEAIVHSSQFDFRFIVFPLFMAGVSTSSAGQKMMAMDLVSSLERQGIGRNATTTRHLLQMVYQSQTEQLMTIGHSANVEWADVMVQQGMQIVNFGL
jgi:Fungal specific transcription factor domain